MVKSEIVKRRLVKLEQYLAALRRLQRFNTEELIADPERHGAAERYLHLAIECIIDVGNHIIADENLGEVNSYSDIPRILLSNKIISHEQCETWIRMIGFRNILAHQYADLDLNIVSDTLHRRLGDLEAAFRVFERYL